MSKRAGVLRIVTLTLIAAACSTQTANDQSKESSVAELTEADGAAVKAQIDAYLKASLAKDWTAFGQTLTPDMVAYPPNQAPVQGRDAFVELLKTFPTFTAFTVDVTEVVGRGDLAYATGNFHLTMQLPDGSTVKDDGSFMEVHQRQPDGSWPYTRLIWHSNAPLPAPPAK